MTYEYLVSTFLGDTPNLEDWLNIFGERGWRLITITNERTPSIGDGIVLDCVFMREQKPAVDVTMRGAPSWFRNRFEGDHR